MEDEKELLKLDSNTALLTRQWRNAKIFLLYKCTKNDKIAVRVCVCVCVCVTEGSYDFYFIASCSKRHQLKL